MSLLLRWLGHGSPFATTAFISLCAIATYGAFALATMGLSLQRGNGWRGIGYAKCGAVLILVLNPLVFLYVGIVWKDVLFSSMVTLAAALILHATAGRAKYPKPLLLLAVLLLVPTPLVRQHGILMAPILLVPCMWSITAGMRNAAPRILAMLGMTAACVVFYACLGFVTGNTIRASGDKSTSVGVDAIQRYDITGMLAAGADPVALPSPLRTAPFLAAAKARYSPDRIDFVLADPAVIEGFQAVQTEQLRGAWMNMVHASPMTYLAVKGEQYAWLLGLHRLDRCLPVHMGIEGNHDYLVDAGFLIGMDARDQALYKASMLARHLALYRHWFYLLIFAACVAVLFRKRNNFGGGGKLALASVSASIMVLYASFFPTVLACDFRYLYPGLTMITVLTLFLLSQNPPRADPTP